MKKFALRTLVAGASLLTASSVLAIGLGSDSEDITVQLTLPEIVDIRNLAGTMTLTVDTATDINNPTASGTTSFSVCGIGFSNYNVTLTSDNGTNADDYTLANSAGDQIDYTVSFNGTTVNATGRVDVDPAVGFVKDGGLGTCSTTNASLSASVATSELDDADGAASDTYTDTLTILVEPV
ncbi:hypothetical protein Mag101_04220 [Microbulbifer agarilyticus]|uniref:Spore coat protein U domain-containing protein n=1 Tax=Microbulbifer agarilyticus TaxID=260552 RepID=A0A1Q2M2N1_9GAMM|nr:hypothetical protein [Microbulbifer agarilyticus]AQQ66930.1 hypothetical protein Mag101_04220 [Microbulbifer agarilyticus]